jgi:hypothetical protein
MTARPVYVAVIGWVLIVIGILSIISVALVVAVPSLVPGFGTGASPIALNLATSAIELACGWFVLKGENMARLVYLALGLASMAYLFLAGTVDSTMLILWAVVVILTNIGLFTPEASRFFAGAAPVEAEPTDT